MRIFDQDYLLVTLDFETFYAPKYSLTVMNTFAYVAHPLFSIHGVGVQVETYPRQWFRNTQDALDYIDSLNEQNLPIALLCHNTYFDGWILHHLFDWHPDLYLDTMCMSRGMFPTESAGLGALAERLWPNDPKMRKGKELVQFKGVTTEQLWSTPALEDTMRVYCIGNNRSLGDVGLTHAAFMRMVEFYPDDELRLIDLTLRMMCEPVLYIDKERVENCHREASTKREEVIRASGVAESVLSSNTQFEKFLRDRDIPIPLKPSPTAKVKDENGNPTDEPVMIAALGKSDLGFLDLRRTYPDMEPIWAARVAAKSVGEIARAERFLETHEQCNGMMPVPLIYYSAHTGRYGGGEKLNLQNLGRGSELRRSLSVPSRRVKW